MQYHVSLFFLQISCHITDDPYVIIFLSFAKHDISKSTRTRSLEREI